MNKKHIKYFLAISTLMIFTGTDLYSQSLRGLVNDGVENYNDSKFADAEVNFKKGLEKDLESFEAHFNLGDAYYKQQRYDEAIKSFQNALALAETDQQKAGVYHNVGNSLLKSKKLKESIGAYTNALKLNPKDLETKYNLSYALKQMQQQQNQQQQQQQNQDQNKDDKDNKDNKDQQNNDQNKQEQDKKEQNKKDQNKQDQNQDKKQNQDQQQQKQQPQPKDKMSKEEAQRILQALKNEEKDLQKKLRKHKGKVIKREKDW